MDYEELLSFYTHRGFRVIACATKHIATLDWLKVEKMGRHEAESDLEFLGFIVFENKLKPATTGIINELNNANIRKVMCTGDNILTAISVARDCQLIDRTAHCFIPHFVEGLWALLLAVRNILLTGRKVTVENQQLFFDGRVWIIRYLSWTQTP